MTDTGVTMGILNRIRAAFVRTPKVGKVSQSRLKPGLWGNRRPNNGLFGLNHDQGVLPPENRAVYQGWWFNENGELIGYGDLSWGDLDRIQFELNRWEAFVVTGTPDNAQGEPAFSNQDTLFMVTRDAIVVGPRYHQDTLFPRFSSGMIQATMKLAQQGLISERR